MSPHARAQTAFWRARARSKRDPYLVFPNITSIFEVNVSRCPHNVKSRVQWKMKACLIVECCGCMMHFMFFHSNSDLLSLHNTYRLKSKICEQENCVYNTLQCQINIQDDYPIRDFFFHSRTVKGPRLLSKKFLSTQPLLLGSYPLINISYRIWLFTNSN